MIVNEPWHPIRPMGGYRGFVGSGGFGGLGTDILTGPTTIMAIGLGVLAVGAAALLLKGK